MRSSREISSALGDLSRRAMLKGTIAAAVTVSAVNVMQAFAAGPAATEQLKCDPLHYRDKGTRLIISM